MALKSRRERVGERLLFLSLASLHLEGGESSHQSNGSIAKLIEHVPGCLRTSHGECTFRLALLDGPKPFVCLRGGHFCTQLEGAMITLARF